MSIYTTAYAAYGIPLPPHLDEVTVDAALGPIIVDDLNALGADDQLGYLNAAPYDHDRLFLVTACIQVEIGDDAKPVPIGSPAPAWDLAIHNAAVGLGLNPDELPAPGWFVVVDQS